MNPDEPKLMLDESPFSERMQRWWVRTFVLLQTTNQIQVQTSNKEYPKVVKEGSLVSRFYHLVPDERFKDLEELERKYRQEDKVSKKEWKQVEKKLYPMVMTLLKENRVTGHFNLAPMQDLIAFNELKAKLDKLEGTVNAVAFDLNVLKNEARRQGWKV